MGLGMLEGERGKGLPVAAAPRFLAGVIEREQFVEPACAGVIRVRVLGAALGALMHRAIKKVVSLGRGPRERVAE